MIRLGIIGCGTRASKLLEAMMGIGYDMMPVAVADIDPEGAREKLAQLSVNTDEVTFYDSAADMLENGGVDGVIVSTRCGSHTDFAIEVMKKGVPMLLEKPIATTHEDVARLEQAGKLYKSPVVVSFPLRMTPLAKLAREIIQSGKIGRVGQVQAVNNVPYGGVYFHGWYRDEAETKGLFLQKATHDFDYITHILGDKAVRVCAVKNKMIFTGDKPAGQRCPNCPEYETCPESTFVMKHVTGGEIWGDMCCFAVDTGNEDAGSAIVEYDSGVHVCYTQNFYARRTAAKRGARFIGYDGTLEFDWYTDELKVHMHHEDRVETHTLNSLNMMHGGGDVALARNFAGMIRGREQSLATLEEGIASIKICLAATDSADTHTFRDI